MFGALTSIDISRPWREEDFICKTLSLLQRSNMSIEKTEYLLALQRSAIKKHEKTMGLSVKIFTHPQCVTPLH